MADRATHTAEAPAPASGAPPAGARAFWVQWLLAKAAQRAPVVLSPAAAYELARLLERSHG